MKVIFYLPPDSYFMPSLEAHYLISAYAGEARIMLIDSRPARWEIEPEVPAPPAPPLAETETYKVISSQRLNVRADHSVTAPIKARLNPGEEFILEVGAAFEDTDNDILWRKMYSTGYWVAVSREGVVYAEKVDTSSRAG